MSVPPDCCEKLISTITQSLSIPEVIIHIKNAFRERHLADVQNLLRENEMKQEISFLKRKLEENSQENQRKCAELEEEKRALKINELQMVNAKDKLILDLKGKINELKAKLLVNERLFGVYRDKYNKCLDTGIVEDLAVKQIEAEKAMEKLKSEILESNKARDELKVKKSESDMLAEMYKTRLENLSPRISKIEMGFADIYTAEFGSQNDGSGNRRRSGLPKKVGHANAAQLVTAKGCFSKIVRSSSAAAGGDIIEIIDCDDDVNPDGAPDISKGCGGSNVSEKEVSFVRYSSSSQRSKRNRISNLTTKKNTSTGNKAGPESVSPTLVEKFNRSNDSYTDSDDDSCTDSRMDDLIASLRGKTKSTS